MLSPLNSSRYGSHVHAYCAYFVTFFIYTLLILIMRSSSARLIKQYEKIIVFNIIVDSSYILTCFFFYCDNVSINTDQGVQYFILITGVVEYPPLYITWIISGLTMLSLYWMIGSIPVNFIYWYFLIRR